MLQHFRQNNWLNTPEFLHTKRKRKWSIQGTYYKRLLAGLAWVGLQTIFPVCLPLNNSFFLWKSGTFQRLNAFNEPQCCASAAAGVGNEARNNVAVRVPGCVSHCCGNAARTAACFTCRRWSSPLQNVFLLQFCSPAVITPVMCVCVHACVCVHVCVCYATSFLWKYNNLQNRRGTKEKWSSYFPSVVRSSPCCPLTAAGTEQPVKESLFGKAEGKDELTQEVICFAHIWPLSFEDEMAWKEVEHQWVTGLLWGPGTASFMVSITSWGNGPSVTSPLLFRSNQFSSEGIGDILLETSAKWACPCQPQSQHVLIDALLFHVNNVVAILSFYIVFFFFQCTEANELIHATVK